MPQLLLDQEALTNPRSTKQVHPQMMVTIVQMNMLGIEHAIHLLGYVRSITYTPNHTMKVDELVFEEELRKKKGFYIKRVKEDGNCLFRSIGK